MAACAPAAVVARVVHAVVAGRVEHQLQRPPQAAHQLGVGEELLGGEGGGPQVLGERAGGGGQALPGRQRHLL